MGKDNKREIIFNDYLTSKEVRDFRDEFIMEHTDKPYRIECIHDSIRGLISEETYIVIDETVENKGRVLFSLRVTQDNIKHKLLLEKS